MVRTTAHKRILGLVFLLSLTVSTLTGCGIIQGDHSNKSGVVVTPASADVRAGDTLQFSAEVTGGGTMAQVPPPPVHRIDRDEMRRENFMGKSNSQADANAQVTWSVNGIA